MQKKVIRDQLQEKQVGKQLDNVTNDNQRFFVSDSIILFDAGLDFPWMISYMCQAGAGKTTILVRTFYKDRMEVRKTSLFPFSSILCFKLSLFSIWPPCFYSVKIHKIFLRWTWKWIRCRHPLSFEEQNRNNKAIFVLCSFFNAFSGQFGQIMAASVQTYILGEITYLVMIKVVVRVGVRS